MSDDAVVPGEPLVFTAIDIGTMLDTDGAHWPTAVIDADGYPEIADLARVHAVEGIGDIATEAACVEVPADHRTDDLTHLFVLGIIVTVPVRCAFGVSFALPQQRIVLDDAIEAGHLVIATTPPDSAEVDQPLWLAIDIDPTSLAAALPS